MDEDRLTPQLGRIIDAAKAAAAGGGAGGAGAAVAAEAAGAAEGAASAADAGAVESRAEGWAVLGGDGKVYPAPRLAAAVAAAHTAGTGPEAAAFAVVGEPDDTLLPRAGWRTGAEQADPQLPVAVKYLGRWVLVTLEEIPAG